MLDLQSQLFQPLYRGIFHFIGPAPQISNNNPAQLIKFMSPASAGFVMRMHNEELTVTVREVFNQRNSDPVAALELIQLFLKEEALDVTPVMLSHAAINSNTPAGPMTTMARSCFSGDTPVSEGLPSLDLTGPTMADILNDWFLKAHAEFSRPEYDPRWTVEVAASLALWKLRSWLWSAHAPRLINQRVRNADGTYSNAYDALVKIAENAPYDPEEPGDDVMVSGELVTLLADNPQLEETAIRLLDAFGIDLDWYDPKYTYKDIVTYLGNGVMKLFTSGYNVNRMLLAAVKSIY